MKKFGFGSMRLPCNSDDPKDIDLPQIFEMVDDILKADSITLILHTDTMTD